MVKKDPHNDILCECFYHIPIITPNRRKSFTDNLPK